MVVTRGLSPLPPTIRSRWNQGFGRNDDTPSASSANIDPIAMTKMAVGLFFCIINPTSFCLIRRMQASQNNQGRFG